MERKPTAGMMRRLDVPVPARWLQIVRSLGTDNVVLTGGALRDHLCGKQVKDLDLFVFGDDVPWTQLVERLANAWELTMESDTEGYTPGVSSITNFELPDCDEPVNLMRSPLLDKESVIRRCDFGLCQIGMGTDGVVWVTEAFVDDCANKTFTFIPTEFTREDASRTRWQRLREKYPDYTLKGLPDPVDELENLFE